MAGEPRLRDAAALAQREREPAGSDFGHIAKLSGTVMASSKLRLSSLLAILLVARAPALADAPAADTRPAEAAAAPPPYAALIDDQTVAVARVDLGGINLDASIAWLNELGKTAGASEQLIWNPNDFVPAYADLNRTVSGLKQSGVRDVYIVVHDPFQMLISGAGPDLVFTLAAGGDAQAVERQVAPLIPGGPAKRHPAVVGRSVVVVSDEQALRRLRDAGPAATTQPAAAAALQKVLSAAGDAPLQLAVVPTNDMRRAFGELLPVLPAQLGGGPTSTLSRGMRWLSLAIRLPPEPSLRLVIQAQDARAADDLLTVANASLKLATDNGMPQPLADALRPKVEADQLVTALDAPALTRIAGDFLIGPMLRAREVSARVRSMNNLKQIGLAAITYADQHKGEFPKSLGELLAGQDAMSPAVLLNPRTHRGPPSTLPDAKAAAEWADRHADYVWLGAGRNARDTHAETVLAYEKPEGMTDGLNLLFADGHVEFENLAEANKAIAASRPPAPPPTSAPAPATAPTAEPETEPAPDPTEMNK